MSFHRLTSRALAFAAMLFCLPALAAQFPVTGNISVGSDSASLPTPSSFGNAGYNPATGYLSSGQFTFSPGTFSHNTLYGTMVVTYQLTQSNTASAMVGSGGDAAFTEVKLKLHVVAVTLGGIPVSVGSSCDFEPIKLGALGGSASATGMTVSQASFVVPPTEDSCGSYKDNINNILTGSSGSITLNLQGNFAPPANNDLIFRDGFDGV